MGPYATPKGPLPTRAADRSTLGAGRGYNLPMPIELIALDLDDTLLRSDLTISPGNIAALREASARGVRIVLASGRNIHSMKRYAEALDAAGPGEYMICTNGAEILETATGKRVFAQSMEPALCREVVAAIEGRDFPWQVYEGGKIKASRRNHWAEEDMRLTGQVVVEIGEEGEDGREALLSRGQTKFLAPGEPARISALFQELSSMFRGRAEVLISKPCFLEVLAEGVDKGAALARLCAILGLGMERTLAAGDAMNDLGMLSAAGFSCAPANAIPEAKARASWVSGRSNEEDFVAEIVRRFVLERPA